MRRTAFALALLASINQAAAADLEARAFLSVPLQAGGAPAIGLSLRPVDGFRDEAPDMVRLDLVQRRLSVAGLDLGATADRLAWSDNSGIAVALGVLGTGALIALVIVAGDACLAFNARCPDDDDDREEKDEPDDDG
ncbi:MAG: hypothetical protein KDE35_11995 [Geminicoccaceae bacterium]|nr:hypothetical protein [Geminicoccaceae bacterium]